MPKETAATRIGPQAFTGRHETRSDRGLNGDCGAADGDQYERDDDVAGHVSALSKFGLATGHRSEKNLQPGLRAPQDQGDGLGRGGTGLQHPAGLQRAPEPERTVGLHVGAFLLEELGLGGAICYRAFLSPGHAVVWRGAVKSCRVQASQS